MVGQLHSGFLSGIGPAANEFADLTLRPLIEYLLRRRHDADPHAAAEAAEEAILGYLDDPTRAHADSGRLVLAHLQLAAWRNLANIARGERRRHHREATFAAQAERDRHAAERRVVERCAAAGKVNKEGSSRRTFAHSSGDKALPMRSSDVDRRIIAMIEAGERRNVAFATVLKLQKLPVDGQRRAVKREKDRIKARVKRRAAVAG